MRLALALALALLPPSSPARAAEETPVVVHLADGSSLPLRQWSLSYEYATWARGSSQALGTTARRDARELWVGRKRLGTAGMVLELEHRMLAHDPAVDTLGPAEIPVVGRLRLSLPGGRGQEIEVEPPHRDLLFPGAPKGAFVVARSLDLAGLTLTGTRRELCVLSYTSMVRCGVERSGRVVKLEFPGKE